MALYPYSVGLCVPRGIQMLPPGTAICFPVTLSLAEIKMIDLVQATGEAVQDFTIRGWISKQPIGNPDPLLPPYLQTWHANKAPGVTVYALYDRALPAPNTIFAIPADPGPYFVNLLNLTNQPNQFWLTVGRPVDTDDDDDLL